MDNRKISICIPTYNRYQMTLESFENILTDSRVDEIVIVDDCSTDDSWDRLIQKQIQYIDKGISKVVLYRNDSNLDCYRNKKRAVELATNHWCILFDSDNILTTDYIDKIYAIEEWVPAVTYLPSWAKPHFDYREFEGRLFTKENIHKDIQHIRLQTALNTANFFVNVDSYLRVFDDGINPHTSDSIFMNYRLLEDGNMLYIVPGLHYEHRVHEGSHYRQNCHKTGTFHNEVINKLQELR